MLSAIRNREGHYYLNGNWRIDFPQAFTFAGCIWHYERTPQGFAAPDSITCIGPTSEAVYLAVNTKKFKLQFNKICINVIRNVYFLVIVSRNQCRN